MVLEIEPHVGLRAVSTEPAWDSLSPLSAPPLLALALSLSLSLKKGKKKYPTGRQVDRHTSSQPVPTNGAEPKENSFTEVLAKLLGIIENQGIHSNREDVRSLLQEAALSWASRVQ